MSDYTTTDVQHAIADAARAIWQRDIHDDGGPAPKVTQLFDRNGWAKWLRNPNLGGCPDGYTRPPDPDYCGHTAAVACRDIGDHLVDGRCLPVQIDPAICHHILPSTYRLSTHGKWESAGYERPAVYDRRRDGEPPPPQRGDIVVVGDRKPYGDHIVVCDASPDGGDFATVEGNAAGTRADGSYGRGVIEGARAIGEIAQIIRIGKAHTVEET